ncbi:Serine/threonine kinase [Mortierella alpina]|nr:Serine/threonine kinase [Mortierella alpina]
MAVLYHETGVLRTWVRRTIWCFVVIGGLCAIVLPIFMIYRKEGDNARSVVEVGPQGVSHTGDYIHVVGSVASVDFEDKNFRVHFEFTPHGTLAGDDGVLADAISVSLFYTTLTFPEAQIMRSVDVTMPYMQGATIDYPFDAYKSYFEILANKEKEQLHKIPVSLTFLGMLQSVEFIPTVRLSNDDLYKIAIEIFTRRSPTTIGFSLFIVLIMWLLSIAIGIIAMQVIRKHRTSDEHVLTLGITTLFALPALRETQPGIPSIGCAADVLGFYWNMAIIAISSILILMASGLRWKEPSIKRELDMVHKQHDFQSKLIKEMAIPMPFPLTGGPFSDYQVRKKRMPFMFGRHQQQHPQTYGHYAQPHPLHRPTPSNPGPERTSFVESITDIGHTRGASGQEGLYYTHGDPFRDGSSHYGRTDSRHGGDIEQGYSPGTSGTGSNASDHPQYQTPFTHVRKANDSQINENNNSSTSTLGSQHVKDHGLADHPQRTHFRRNQGIETPAKNMPQGSSGRASENDIMPWGPSTSNHVSLPLGASAAPSVNSHAAQSYSSAWNRLPPGSYQTLAQSMLEGTEAGYGLATASETRLPALSKPFDSSTAVLQEMDDDQKLEDVRKRLQKEKEIKAATMKLRDFQQSEAAKAACDATMEESQQRINYFQNEFDKLQLKKQESSPKVPRTQIAITLPSMENAPPMMKAGFDSQGRSYSGQSPDMRMNPSRKASDSSSHYPDDFISHRPLSTVDLLKAPTPITSKKVTYKLRELAYKLDIEKKVKLASERLEQLGMSAKEGNAESSERVVLLRRALQKYQGLYIPGQAEDDTTSAPGTALRRPMTGTLYVRVGGIKHQNNAPTRNARPPESMAYIKIDGTPRAKTRMARNGPGGIRWNEDFEVPVTKASEIEIAVFDKPDSVPVPIGLFWLKISDLVEELRRKKVEADNDAAWVAANVQDLVARTPTVRPGTGPLGDNPINGVEGIESWWDLEPIGQISLKFNFVKDVAVRKRPSGLGRQGAVRKRKDEVREIQGHKFVSQKFFQIMCCALCAELFTGKAAQCEDCKFTCHQKCADKVFIKCISSKTVEDPDEAKLNHRIPHRFETFTNLSPTWCSHCGHMLTFGRRHKKCTECPAVAHEGCSDLVPNHCGMPAETANKLIEELRRRTNNGRTPQTPTKTSRPPSYDSLANEYKQPPLPQRPTPPVPQGERPQLPYRPDGRPDQTVSQGHELNQQRLQQQLQQMHLHQQQQQKQQLYDQEQQQRKVEQQRLYEQQQQQHQQHQQQLQYQKQQFQLQQQQQKQQMQQKQLLEAERAHRLAQESTALEDKFRNEQARLEQLRLQQEKNQQRTPPVTPHMEQRPLVMPTPHMPTLKIVNKQPPKPTRKYGLNDFHFLAVLGKGNFGKVMLAEDKKGGELFAIKVLKKESIVKQDEIESARSEKRIYQVANKERHPFLTTLHSCFQTDTRLYFVMEYVRGGDLMMHIQKDKRFGEHRAKFYGCEVLLALQYFHQNNIVYRDLKLDNILLTVDGHIKIADYGLCKENMPFGATTRTICGTPEFMAPEILEEQPYDRAVDWWAFGVLMYEMLLGRAPFSGEEEDDIYDSILEDEPLYPHGFGRHEQALLQSLLVKVPSLRLGSGPSDADEIKAHAYFRNVNFDDVYHKRIRPPFLPKVSSATDVSNFDSEFTSEAPGETPTDYRLDRVEQDLFKGFSYVSPWAHP